MSNRENYSDGSGSVSRLSAVVAFALGTLFFFYAFVQRVAPSVMTDELMRDFSVGGVALGTLSATYFYTYASMQLPVGMLMDRFGPRKLLSSTAAICAVASLCFSFSNSLLMASVSRALIGGSVAFAFVGSLTVATMFFPPKRFALLAGILMSVGMCGAIVGQAPLRILLEHVGWRHVFLQLAAVAITMAVLLYVLVPKRAQKIVASGSKAEGILSGLGSVSRNQHSWWCAGAGFGLSATMLSFAGLWAVPWLTSTIGFGSTQAAGITSTMFIGWALGAPAMGWMSDRIGRRKPVVVIGALLTLLTLMAILYGGFTSPFLLTLLFLMNGVSASSMVICFAQVRELNLARHNATAIGLVNMCVVGAGAVMQPLIGWLLDSRWQGSVQNGARMYTHTTYNFALTSLIVTLSLALLCALMVAETYCKPMASDAELS